MSLGGAAKRVRFELKVFSFVHALILDKHLAFGFVSSS